MMEVHTQPAVSVIIPTYNYARFLGEAIDSVLAQTYPVKEIIVVDDGSTDGTASILAKYGDGVQVFRQQNRGPAAARNEGVKHAGGELIAFLDADDSWVPDKLAKQVRKFREGNFGVVNCGIRHTDEEGRFASDNVAGGEGWIYTDILRGEKTVVQNPSTFVMPRSIYAEVGGMDESLQVSEDRDFIYRVARRYRVAFVPEALVYYRVHHCSTGSRNIASYETTLLRMYDRAFAEDTPELRSIRRICYGNLRLRIAIWFFHAGAYRRCALNLAWALWFRPRLVGRLVRSAMKRAANLIRAEYAVLNTSRSDLHNHERCAPPR
jgi:glycosyltransferase involved in cell wall biosynthesis